MIALMLLAVVWAAFLVPQILRRHREGRPGSSVVSFRQQLSTLERATPGHSLRLSTTGPVPIVRSVPPASRTQVRRRRDVLLALAGATAFTFLLVLASPGTVTTLAFMATGSALGAYVWALVQIRKRTAERTVKVRVLAPRTLAPRTLAPAPSFALRRTVSS